MRENWRSGSGFIQAKINQGKHIEVVVTDGGVILSAAWVT